MNEFMVPCVDVVIPVYNAPLLARRCIDSVVTYLSQSVRRIDIQDDASEIETRLMLDNLPYKQIHVHHAQKNQGFGKSVNEAIARSDADLVLVLNSDTEVSGDILTPLCKALAEDPQLAVISPNYKFLSTQDLDRFLRRPGGYISAYRFQGYAFLIRRSVFQELGGFDPAFGRGYFEDIDLGRRLDLHGWHMGIHPDAQITHKGGGSFGRGLAYHKLININRAFYLSRYPKARRNIVFLSSCYLLTALPNDLFDAIEKVFRDGGNVHWLTPDPVPQLLCFHMRNNPANLWVAIKLMLRGLHRRDKQITEIWLFSDIPYFTCRLFLIYARFRRLRVKLWRNT